MPIAIFVLQKYRIVLNKKSFYSKNLPLAKNVLVNSCLLCSFAKIKFCIMETTSGILSMVYEMKKKCAELDQQLMEDLNISQSELLFFSALNNCQGISSPELARGMGLSLSRISRVVEKLVVNGYLDRTTDTVDRRAITLCLTPKGKIVRNKIDHVRNECEARLLDAMPSEEIERFRTIISKIVKNI